MCSVSSERQVVAIVDDEPSILRGLKRLLDVHGFAVEIFPSGEAFLERGDIGDVSCVVLDIHLNGMSGIEIRRRLAAASHAVPVIFMTALDSAAIRKEAIDTGCAAYLHKPFPGRELIDAIRKATSSRSSSAFA